jgi:ATP-binding cassette, subfamily G (WHITE), member 2
VLKNLSGYVKPGQFLAIIGPSGKGKEERERERGRKKKKRRVSSLPFFSGSGKTSLLNVLAQRVSERDGKVTGDILLNGKPVQSKNFKRVSGYVMQDDIMLSFLTVRETLSFTAKLRVRAMGEEKTERDKEERRERRKRGEKRRERHVEEKGE